MLPENWKIIKRWDGRNKEPLIKLLRLNTPGYFASAEEKVFDAAVCIGCGACVATCKNASSSLFTASKINHLSMLPQGKPEANERVKTWWPKWMPKALEHAPLPELAK